MTIKPNNKTKPLTVTQLTRAIKSLLEGSIGEIVVEGEISNWRVAGSGHSYFILKDEKSSVNCVMFKNQLFAADFQPEDGKQVKVFGRIGVYEPRGQYQIIVETMKEAGLGALFQAFLDLKNKLEKEGLFKPEHKKPVPYLPQKIGIVTSPSGAVIQDIINVINRRFANVELYLYPVVVQGDQAASEISQAIKRFNKLNLADVLIIGRGGGSIEDLWAFNDEVLARTIFDSKIPIISAVGHEIDFTIADFVADLRAPTPSAAAELVIKNREELLQRIISLSQSLFTGINYLTNFYKESLLRLIQSYALRRLPDKLLNTQQQIDELTFRLKTVLTHLLKDIRQRLTLASEKLGTLNPEKVLSRGYSIVYQADTKEIVKDGENVSQDDFLDIKLFRGKIRATVIKHLKETR